MGYDKQRRPPMKVRGENTDIKTSTSNSANIDFWGFYALTSTSTGNGTATNWTLNAPIKAGDKVELYCQSVGATSSPQHVTLPSGFAFDDDSTAANNLLTMSTVGCAATLRAVSTSRVALVGEFGVSISTST